jgi:hypothetical protein
MNGAEDSREAIDKKYHFKDKPTTMGDIKLDQKVLDKFEVSMTICNHSASM